MLKKVMLAYDFSPESHKALRWLLNFLKTRPVQVLVVTVFECPQGLGDNLSSFVAYQAGQPLRQKSVNELQAILSELAAAGFAARSVVLEGEPSFELLEYIDAEQPDVIICGTKEVRRMVGFGTIMPRSVAHTLVTYSSKPVLVVK